MLPLHNDVTLYHQLPIFCIKYQDRSQNFTLTRLESWQIPDSLMVGRKKQNDINITYTRPLHAMEFRVISGEFYLNHNANLLILAHLILQKLIVFDSEPCDLGLE